MGLFWASADGVGLVAATAKTVLELGSASTGSRPKIKEWWVDFDGTSGSAVPVKVEIGRFSAAVTTATTITGEKIDNAETAALTVAKHSTTTEGSGTADDVFFRRFSPTSGYHYIAPLGQEFVMGASTFWRMRLTAAAAVNATFGVVWEE